MINDSSNRLKRVGYSAPLPGDPDWPKPATPKSDRPSARVWLAAVLAGGLFCIAQAAPSAPPEPLRLASGWELQESGRVAEAGEAISQPGYQPAAWHRATVPGTVLTSLVNDGVYPEPLYGENNRPDKIPESLCRTSYWYRTTFTPPAAFTGKRVWLNFHGVNYEAAVWVNGHSVGTIKGAFARGIFDVTAYVTVGSPNGLAVLVLPQPHPGETHEKTVVKGTGLNGGVTAEDGPSFMCAIGWDWIPTIRDRDMGIWQEVTVSASGPVILPDPYVTTELPLPRTDTADVTVRATLRNLSDTLQAGTLSGILDNAVFKQEVSLQPHETRALTLSPATIPALRLRQPRLWWPNGFGPQNLYALHLSFTANGTLSDRQDVRFGVRKIAYAVPGSENLTLCVNGVPVMAKGGDWGMDEAMKRIPRSRLEAQIRMHQLANYTIIRNWVGQSTSDDFYDLCDQYGILLWDEFFQPNPADGPNPQDAELYLANVREKILRYRNHPSIALWCARNEGDPPPAIGQGIQKLIDELDSGRLYQPSSTSGRGVNSGGPYHWRVPRDFYTFNEAFKTEIGSMSVPTLEAIRAMLPSKDWEVITDDWAEHDFCAGAQQGDLYPGIISDRYGPCASLADFVRKSQLANYECFRAMYEGRFAKLFKPASGVITWMSNPAQPSFVWQLYSHDLEPNAALFGTRKACEPLHVQLNQANWHVQVINHTAQALEGEARISVYNLDGSLQSARTNTVAAPPSAATDLGPLDFPNNLSAVHFVKLELRDARKRLVSDNFYWRAAGSCEDDFQPLNSLPMAALDVQATERKTGGKCLLAVQVRNPGRSVALMAHFQLRRAGSGQRVLPVYYSDNYLSLLPGESRELTVEAALADLGNDEPLLAVDGWNVTVNAAAAGGKGVRVAPNTDAQVPNTPVPSTAPGTVAVESINCGGGHLGFFRFGATEPVFTRDRNARGGNLASTTDAIEVSAANAAPAAVYQTERWGRCTYAISVPPGRAYTVRLHFAEVKAAPGERKFNVDLNGQRVLTDYDIAGEVGQAKAAVKDFPSVKPDGKSQIVIALTKGSAGEPKICGIEILK